MRAGPTHAERRRAELIGTVAAILDQGEPTRFAFEGAARAGLRSAFCLASWPWAAADREAAIILEDAFKALGVSRPSWYEGQPEYVERVGGGFTCRNCGVDLGEDRHVNGRERAFCSRLCLGVWHKRRERMDDNRQARAAYLATLAAKTEANRPNRPCAECGKPFRPKTIKGEHHWCSKSCAAKGRWRRRREQSKPSGSTVGG